MKLIWISFKQEIKPDFIDDVGIISIGSTAVQMQSKRKATIVENHAACLNAENNQADLILWTSNDFKQIQALSPIKQPYGWVLATLNAPLFLTVSDLDELNNLSEINFEGIFSEDLELLRQIHNQHK